MDLLFLRMREFLHRRIFEASDNHYRAILASEHAIYTILSRLTYTMVLMFLLNVFPEARPNFAGAMRCQGTRQISYRMPGYVADWETELLKYELIICRCSQQHSCFSKVWCSLLRLLPIVRDYGRCRYTHVMKLIFIIKICKYSVCYLSEKRRLYKSLCIAHTELDISCWRFTASVVHGRH